MPAYVILDIDVTDPEGYEEYKRLAAPTVAGHGGRYIVRGGEARRLDGHWDPARIVVVEFDSLEVARKWYASEEYQQALPVRLRTSNSTAILADAGTLPS